MKNIVKQIGSEAALALTSRPAADRATVGVKPEFIRLPKPGTLCPHTGLTRSKMNELVLPSALNRFKAPVRSISLRNHGQVKAVRLVVYESLLSYLHSLMIEQNPAAEQPAGVENFGQGNNGNIPGQCSEVATGLTAAFNPATPSSLEHVTP